MPTTTTVFTPDALPFQWSGLSEIPRERSAIPRGEVRFFVDNGEIPVPTSGEDGRVTVDCDLPPNFSYVFAEMHFRVDSSVLLEANTWQSIGEFTLNDGNFKSKMEVNSSGNYFNLLGKQQSKLFCVKYDCIDKGTWLADPGPLTAQMQLGNATADYKASLITFYARFWQYDVTQFNHFGVNSPLLVR